MTAPDEYERRLKAAKRASLGQVLLKSARLWNEQSLERVRRTSFPEARASHTQLLPHIDLDGTRLTTLAERVGVSKQAVQQLVSEMESSGVLERVPDPVDGRAKLIRFSRRGRRVMMEGVAILGEIESELRAELGDDAIDRLHETLLGVLDHLERRDTRST